MSRYEEQLQHPKAEERPVMASELFRGIANRTEALLVHLGE
jgi:hypothetical protein